MNGLVLVTTDFSSVYYSTVKEGRFTDGYHNLKVALTCKEDWEPSLVWRFTNIAASSLIQWSEE